MSGFNAAGYLMDRMPGHPTAAKGGLVYLHRVVLYDKIGPGEHPCHYCGRLLSWDVPAPDGLTVEHLDSDKANNDPANLVPSCRGCNSKANYAGRTHCKHGHELTPENTYRPPGHENRQVCKVCRRLRMRVYKRRGSLTRP